MGRIKAQELRLMVHRYDPAIKILAIRILAFDLRLGFSIGHQQPENLKGSGG
jgi:hypothetical protein